MSEDNRLKAMSNLIDALDALLRLYAAEEELRRRIAVLRMRVSKP